MKKITLFVFLLGILIRSYCQPQILSPSFPSSVSLFDLFEVSFTMNVSYSNPYDPSVIAIYAVFFSPNNETYTVNAFYYEDYSFQEVDGYEQATSHPENNSWKIRFTPTSIGNWMFKIVAQDASGAVSQMPNITERYYSFTCTSVENADGFISKANSRFLKRDIVKNGQRQFHSFFPIGPNIAWYSCLKDNNNQEIFSQPKGIYGYKRYIDLLDGNANYMRIWICRYQYLSLYGPEYTQIEGGLPKVYFDSIVNQKDSAELDFIVAYAKQHGVAIMPCFFSFNDFIPWDSTHPFEQTTWDNNPYNCILGLENPCDFFTDHDAIRITKNLIRYIISRWGYATNIMSWEFWNEVSNMFFTCEGNRTIEQDVTAWHNLMAEYVSGIDPFHHCISTSTGDIKNHPYIYSILFHNLDFVQQHNYQNIQKAASIAQFSYVLYTQTSEAHVDYPSHPFFMGEFGFGQENPPSYEEKDPNGIDLHNSLWSSLFSTSIGPASFWWWYYLKSKGLFGRFRPILRFCENLPILSDSFCPNQKGREAGLQLVFDNNLETYYMINVAEDTIYGWSQDTAFAYQSLRWLTDYVYPPGHQMAYHFVTENGVFDPDGYVYTLNLSKRPHPSSNSNIIEIPITNQPVGSRYRITWYDAETGYVYSTGAISYVYVNLNGDGDKVVTISFPPFIRNLQQQTINNTFGDAVFSLILDNLPSNIEK